MASSKVKDTTFSDTQLNNHSTQQLNNSVTNKISKWAFQWKMLFNPDPSKQAIDICFSHKRDSENYPSLVINDTNVQLANSEKYLGLILDSKLDFNEHIDNKIKKCYKTIDIMKRLSLILSRKRLLTVYKSFVRPNLDYAHVIYDKPFNESFKKNEMVQYKAALVITGAIKGTSRDRLYQVLGLKSLEDRSWSRRLFFFHKIIQGLLPSHLHTYLNAASEGAYLTRSTTQIKLRQFLQEPKYSRIHFFHIALRNGVNATTRLEI